MDKNYKELEMNILYCLIQDNELMKELFIEEKYFVYYKRLWKFMKSFYNKFKTFDVSLMYSVCKDKEMIVMYLEYIINNATGFTYNFDLYQNRLIEIAEQSKDDKIKKDLIFNLANDLIVGNINLKEFDTNYKKIIFSEE